MASSVLARARPSANGRAPTFIAHLATSPCGTARPVSTVLHARHLHLTRSTTLCQYGPARLRYDRVGPTRTLTRGMSSLDSFLKRFRADEAPTIDLEAGGRLRARAKNAPSIDLEVSTTRATSMLGAGQRAAIDAVLEGKHVLIHGPGGTGKTHLIDQLRRELRRRNKKVEVTASTGIAAVNVKGRTVHSWSQVLWDKPIAFWPDASPDNLGPPITSRYNLPDVLIIDEISMLSADFMDKLDKRLRYRNRNWAPFGGVQLVAVGDFFQLPPVMKELEHTPRGIKQNLLPTDVYAFESAYFAAAKPTVINLQENYRQGDPAFLDLLQHIRTNGVPTSLDHLALLEQLKAPRPHLEDEDLDHRQHTLRLFTRNKDADDYNATKLARLKGNAMRYKAEDWITDDKLFPFAGQAMKNEVARMTEDNLFLKKGCAVMCIQNVPGTGLVNGLRGFVVDFHRNGNPIVDFGKGPTEVGPYVWQCVDTATETVVAMRSQLPLRLAFAITIHKAQGLTLNSAIIDFHSTFSAHQAYVALSRVRDPSNLLIKNLNLERHIRVDPTVRRWHLDQLLRSPMQQYSGPRGRGM